MLLFLIQDLGSGDEKVRKSDVKKFLTPGYSTSGHVELYTVSVGKRVSPVRCPSVVSTHSSEFNLNVIVSFID